MSSTTHRIARTAAVLAATTAAGLTLATTAGATTRPYLDLPDWQLANVEQFDIDAAGQAHIDVDVPATTPAGHRWELHTSAFAAGQFHNQKSAHELATPGTRLVLTFAIGAPCGQIDMVLVGPNNPTGQPYAADLTDAPECQPGAVPPIVGNQPGAPLPVPVVVDTPAPEADTPAPEVEQPAADTPAPEAAPELQETLPPAPVAEVAAEAPAPVAEVVATPVVVEQPAEVATPIAVATSAGRGPLPVTGRDNRPMAIGASLAMAVGGALLVLARRLRLAGD